MNSKFLFTAFALLFAMILQTPAAHAEAVNMADPKLEQEAAIQANPQVMRAQALVKGVACETGACFKDADPTLGYEPQVKIEPSGAAAPATKTKDGAITK